MKSGDKLGNFEIQEMIGAGGMGEVYLAEDRRLGRRVALKILPAELARDAARRARFAREARAASALSHPNIAHIYDVGDEEGTHFIAMEYVEGTDLGRRLAESSPGQDEILEIAIQVADALEEARQKGIIHRDIKPANIALTAGGKVKVLDFGLAKLTLPLESESGDQTATLSQTAEGTILGTAHYMSPEQAQGGDIDTRSDLFSLGAVLYEMVAGRKAFPGEGILEVVHAITQREPEALARFNYEVPAELERIIVKCLEKNPDHRYQTPRDLLVDLRNLQRTNISQSVSGIAGPRRTSPRRRNVLAGVLAAAAALTAAGFYFLTPSAEAEVDSLVVIPFENTTGDAEVEYLCDGVTESLINTLAQIPELKVISRISAFSFKGQTVDPAAVGRKLDVDALLVGRVVRHGEDLDITTELVAARDSRQIWGDRYTRPVGEIQSISSDITGTIAKTLRVELAGSSGAPLERRAAANPEAYRLYLKGLFFTTGTMREMDSAIDFFNQALELDPDFALAWAGLAHTRIRQLFLRGSGRGEPVELARRAAKRAMELGPDLPEAFTVSGQIKLYFDLDWAGAEADLRKGYELSHGSILPVMTYGDYCIFTGEYDKAVALHKQAQRIDPLSHVTAHDLGFAYMAMKEYDKAAAQFKRAIELNPNWVWGHIKLGKTYAHMGRFDEALAENALAENLLTGSGTPAARSWLDYTYALCGETEKARAGLADLESREDYVDPALMAIIQIGLGEIDDALANFEQSYEDHSPDLVFIKMSPDLYPGQWGRDPRFQDLIRRLGIPQ